MTTTTSDELGVHDCHDHFEHPLLWCEDKRRLMERRNAEESLRMWRRRKAEEIARKDREKQEYYELFVKHCPWGRPGGGAPNVDVRRKDITAVGLHSTPKITAVQSFSALQPPCRYADYFSQRKKCHDPVAAYHHHHHHHVPRLGTHVHQVTTESTVHPVAGSTVTICERDVGVGGPGAGATSTSTGKESTLVGNGAKNAESLQITLKDHPSMSFRNKGHVDIEVRYKPTAPGKGKPMLEKIVVTETDKCPLAVVPPVQKCKLSACDKGTPKKKIEIKVDKPPYKEPWGKAGPGGKPWRSPKAIGSTFMKSLGWTNKEMLKDLDQDNPATPAEKQTFRKPRASKKLQRCCDMCVCTCPALTSSSLKPHQRKVLQACPNKSQNTLKLDSLKQKFCPRFARRCAAATGKMAATVASGGVGQTTTTEHSANTVNAEGGGVELVPLLARRRANNRPISLSSTDVTKRTASNDRLPTAPDLHYLHDLNAQISQKRRSISYSLQLERELCNKHFETFDTYWGRPGHGAPSEIRNKLKLDNLLYGGVQGCASE